ncbi:MAG: hypothetical protein NUV80_00355 [Candidatus Berkelbacteria bacterium]|nr:hypothetical protein [Candidatus Berkelbacteria bacterium]MCR4307000.1 hypothetical protein [Candidatus Berkelbacteria bacterium]
MPEENERKAISVIKALSNLTDLVYVDLKTLSYAEAFERAVIIISEYELIDDLRGFLACYGLPDPRDL